MATGQKPGESGLDHAQNLHQVTQPNPSLSFHTSATIMPCTIAHHFVNLMLFAHIYELGHRNNPITLYNLSLVPDFKIIPVSSATFSTNVLINIIFSQYTSELQHNMLLDFA